MAENTLFMVTGPATLALGGTDIASINEEGVKIIAKTSGMRLGQNNGYAGPKAVIGFLEEVIIEFESLEADVLKIATAFGALATSEQNAVSPNYAYLDYGNAGKLVPASLVISTVGPEYESGKVSIRTITASAVVPLPESMEQIFGLDKKQSVKFRFLALVPDSGNALTIVDTWT